MPRVATSGRVAVAGRGLVSGRQTIVERQQKLTDSQNPAGANWTGLALTSRTANFGTNPFGSAVDSVQLEESAGGAVEHAVYNSASLQTFVETGWYTLSCWFRAGTRNFGGFLVDGGVINFGALFNVTTGANTFLGILAGASADYGTTFIVGSWPTPSVAGWTRVFFAFEVLRPRPPSIFVRVNMSNTGAGFFYVGAAGQTLEMWNPQLVKGNWPGPPVQSNPAPINGSSLRLLVANT